MPVIVALCSLAAVAPATMAAGATLPARPAAAGGHALARRRAPRPAGVSRSGQRAAAAQVAAPAQCNVAPGGWTTPDPDRFTTCEGMNYAWQAWLTNSDGSQTLAGELDWTVYEWATTSGLSGDPTWQHGMMLDVTNVWGAMSPGLTAVLRSTCDSYTTACTTVSSAADDTQSVTLVAGVSYANSWTEKDNGPAITSSGQVDTFDNTIGLQYTYRPNITQGYTDGSGVDTSDAAGSAPSRLATSAVERRPETGSITVQHKPGSSSGQRSSRRA
jgi:hypothetical protein